jgi:hypothetical protein
VCVSVVCVCVCVCLCVCVCVHVCARPHRPIRKGLCLGACGYVCVCVILGVCGYVCVCVILGVCGCVCVYVILGLCSYACVYVILGVCGYVCVYVILGVRGYVCVCVILGVCGYVCVYVILGLYAILHRLHFTHIFTTHLLVKMCEKIAFHTQDVCEDCIHTHLYHTFFYTSSSIMYLYILYRQLRNAFQTHLYTHLLHIYIYNLRITTPTVTKCISNTPLHTFTTHLHLQYTYYTYTDSYKMHFKHIFPQMYYTTTSTVHILYRQ